MPQRHGDEMNVVRHQTPCQEPDFRIDEIQPEEFDIGVAVVDGGECFPAIHTALSNVASHAGNKTTGLSGHMVGCSE